MACTQAITHRLNLVEYGAVTEIAKNARLVLFTIDQDNVAIFQWFHVVQAVAMGNVCLAVVALQAGRMLQGPVNAVVVFLIALVQACVAVYTAHAWQVNCEHVVAVACVA